MKKGQIVQIRIKLEIRPNLRRFVFHAYWLLAPDFRRCLRESWLGLQGLQGGVGRWWWWLRGGRACWLKDNNFQPRFQRAFAKTFTSPMFRCLWRDWTTHVSWMIPTNPRFWYAACRCGKIVKWEMIPYFFRWRKGKIKNKWEAQSLQTTIPVLGTRRAKNLNWDPSPKLQPT